MSAPDSDDAPRPRFDLYRQRSPSPQGWEYEIPAGEFATPAQLAEYRRRQRQWTIKNALVYFVGLPAAAWLGVSRLTGLPAFLGMLVIVAAFAVVLALVDRSFRCPVCERPLDRSWNSRRRSTPARLAFLRSGVVWCDSCGTRFRLHTYTTVLPDDDDDGIL